MKDRKEVISARIDYGLRDQIDKIAQEKSELVGVEISRSSVIAAWLKKMVEESGSEVGHVGQ